MAYMKIVIDFDETSVNVITKKTDNRLLPTYSSRGNNMHMTKHKLILAKRIVFLLLKSIVLWQNVNVCIFFMGFSK